jgi:hypothetical protein
MPRAIEIRVDPITKGVIIDTNFPNREVQGSTWEPRLLRLGWDLPEEIWTAMDEACPREFNGPIGDEFTQGIFCPTMKFSYHGEAIIKNFEPSEGLTPQQVMIINAFTEKRA